MPAENKSHFSTSIEVIFRDIDALGHVNNAVYFTYMETARTRFFIEKLDLLEPGQLPLILARTSCTFHQAARFGDQLRIEVKVSRIGNKSFDLLYLIKNKNEVLIAEGESVLVSYDYAKRTSVVIPPQLKSLLESLHSNNISTK